MKQTITAVDGEVLNECMGGDVTNQNDFLSRFKVGPLEEQKGVSGDQKGKTTVVKEVYNYFNWPRNTNRSKSNEK